MTLSETEIDTLIKDLGSFRARKREHAIEILSRRRDECFEVLISRLTEEAIGYQMQSGFAHAIWRYRWLMLLALLPLLMNSYKDSDGKHFAFIFLATLSPALIMGIGLIVSIPTWRFSALLKILESSDEPRLIRILLDLLDYQESFFYLRVDAIVLDHLKSMNAPDIPLFDIKQRKILCRMLFKQNSDETNIITILRALQQTAGSESIPAIKRMIREGHTEAVRQAARQCLASIEYRQQEGNVRDTLLRASDNTAVQEELLRAANPTTDTQAETLLRVPEE